MPGPASRYAFGPRPVAALSAVLVALVVLLSACATPVPPRARSAASPLQTPTPIPPTPTPEPVTADPDPTDPADPIGDEVVPEPTMPAVPGVQTGRIQIASVVDNFGAESGDDVFLSVREGLLAWRLAVNNRGGVAGRRVELVEFGTTAGGNHRAAMEAICNDGNFFAVVGSMSLRDGDGMDLVDTDDCLLPDFPAIAMSPARQQSPTTFLSNPFINGEYDVGLLRNRAEADPEAVQEAALIQLDTSLSQIQTLQMREAAESLGYNFVFSPTVSAETDWSILATSLLDAEPRGLVWTADWQRLADLLIAVDEIDPEALEFVLCVASCYDQRFVETLGDVSPNIYTSIPHLPFEEAEFSAQLRDYLLWLRVVHPAAVPSTDGLAAWSAGLLFEEAVNQAVQMGPNFDESLLAQDNVIEAARQIESWTAKGLFGESAPGPGIPSPCQVILRLVDGGWERVLPLTANRDCSLENIALLRATSNIGVAETSSITSGATSEATDAGDEVPLDAELDEDISSTDPLEQIDEIPE